MSKQEKTTTASRLAAYSAVAAATAVAGGAANAAEVVWDIVDVTGGDIRFNVASGAVGTGAVSTQGDFQLLDVGYDFVLNSTPSGYGAAASTAARGFASYLAGSGYQVINVVSPLSTGGTVSAGDNFENVYTGGAPYIQFYDWFFTEGAPNGDKGLTDGERGFVGLKFSILADTFYGWAEVTVVDSNNITLHQFGYNDTPGAASQVVPEPSSLALLAMGGTALLRRKRKNVA